MPSGMSVTVTVHPMRELAARFPKTSAVLNVFRSQRPFAGFSHGVNGSSASSTSTTGWIGASAKQVYDWVSSARNLVQDERFLHDGWHVVAVLGSGSSTILNTMLWGSDLSGSMQGAGGVLVRPSW